MKYVCLIRKGKIIQRNAKTSSCRIGVSLSRTYFIASWFYDFNFLMFFERTSVVQKYKVLIFRWDILLNLNGSTCRCLCNTHNPVFYTFTFFVFKKSNGWTQLPGQSESLFLIIIRNPPMLFHIIFPNSPANIILCVSKVTCENATNQSNCNNSQ